MNSSSPDQLPPTLPYQPPTPSDARFDLSRSSQMGFGMLYCAVGTALTVIAASVMGGLAVLIFAGLILGAVTIQRECKWPAFGRGIFFGLLLAPIVIAMLGSIAF